MHIYIIVFTSFIILYTVVIIILRKRVIRYVKNNYTNITGMSVSWTIFGPIAPGSGNKFYVRLSINNDQYLTFYAMTSLFGDVFISKEGSD